MFGRLSEDILKNQTVDGPHLHWLP